MRSLSSQLILSGLAFVVAASAATANQWPDAFSRRSYQLGMTISEFRKIPYPDPDKARNAYSVCSNEKKANEPGYEDSLLFGGALEKAGVIKCAYYWQDKDLHMVFGAGIMLGDIFSKTEFYFLSPKDGAEPVLFMIDTGGPTADFDRLLPVLEKGYGEPQHIVEAVKNGVGNTFDNDIYTWTTRSSSITFKRYGSTLNVFQIKHTLQPVIDVLSTRLDDIQSEQAKKL